MALDLGAAGYTGKAVSYLKLASSPLPFRETDRLVEHVDTPETFGLYATPVPMPTPNYTRMNVRDVYLDNELLFRKSMYGSLLQTQYQRYAHTLNPRYIL